MQESGQISITDYVRITSTECAGIFNIYPRKGAILPGSDADIIVLNPNASFEITASSYHSQSDTNVYEGRKGKRYLDQQGFQIVGYGCSTCIGNSGELDESVASAISDNDLATVAVLSGNRNFEGRVHPLSEANYLASPPLVVAYAIAGTVDIDFENEPLGTGKDGNSVYFKDIWPSNEEIAQVVQSSVLPDMFRSTYQTITKGNPMWNQLPVSESTQPIFTTRHISRV